MDDLGSKKSLMKSVPTKFEVHTTIFGNTSEIKTKKPGMKNLIDVRLRLFAMSEE